MDSYRVTPRAALLAIALIIVMAACASAPNESRTDPAPDLTAEDIRRNPDIPIEEALMARVPGLWITRAPDGSLAMRIRGEASINADNSPLYVVDGMTVDGGPHGSLPGLNPHDIESIRVLKGPTDTAMYGMRGANGVIIITTKRPGT